MSLKSFRRAARLGLLSSSLLSSSLLSSSLLSFCLLSFALSTTAALAQEAQPSPPSAPVADAQDAPATPEAAASSVAAQQAAPPDQAAADQSAGVGTLVVDVAAFRSEKDLPKKVVRQLEKGGLEWGLRDRRLVFTMVAKQYIDFPISHLTRYGTSETLTLPAGEYRITGIGLELSTAFSVEKILEKGAYVNEDVVVFVIQPGRTTTLSIVPEIRIDRTFAVNFWVPSIMTRVVDDAGAASPAVSLNDRTEASIAWPNYTGPLKFVSGK